MVKDKQDKGGQDCGREAGGGRKGIYKNGEETASRTGMRLEGGLLETTWTTLERCPASGAERQACLEGGWGEGKIFFKGPLQDFFRNQHPFVLRHHDGAHGARHRIFHHDAVGFAAQDDADGRVFVLLFDVDRR